MTKATFDLAASCLATSLLTACLAATGCTVRAMGPMPVPIVVHAAPPPRRPPPVYQPAPVYQQQPAPGYQPPAQRPQPAACIDPGDRDISDLYDRATPLDANSTTVACIARSDADMFSVTVPPAGAGQIVRFALRGQHEMAPIIDIFDVNRKRVHRDSGRGGQEVQGWVHVAGGTLIYIRISQIHGAFEAYTLAMTAGPLAEPGEPNGGYEQATLIPPSGTTTGFMGNPVNDRTAADDWYRIDVTSDGPLSITIDMSQNIAPTAELLDVNRRRIARQNGNGGERIQLQVANVRRGMHYLRLGSIHGIPDSGTGDLQQHLTRPYSITVSR